MADGREEKGGQSSVVDVRDDGGSFAVFPIFSWGGPKKSSGSSSPEPGPRLIRKEDAPTAVPGEFVTAPSPEFHARLRARRLLRSATEVLSQELAFYPYTTVTFSGSNSSEFDVHEAVTVERDPALGVDVEYIRPESLEGLERRFIYLLVESASIKRWLEKTFDAAFASSERVNTLSLRSTGKPFDELDENPFVVSRVFFVEGGRYREAPIERVRERAPRGEFPSLDGGKDTFRLRVYEGQLIWAYGSPVPLTEEQIDLLEKADWPEFPTVSVGPNVGVKMGNQAGLRIVAVQVPPFLPKYVSGIPVVDPLLILENLKTKYHVTCDVVHSHLGRFQDEKEQVRKYKVYQAALGTIQLFEKRAKVSGAVPKIQRVIDAFEEEHKAFAQDAELAAETIRNWLQSEQIRFVEELSWSVQDDKQLLSCGAYAQTFLELVPRLPETETGKQIIEEILDELEKAGEPEAGGARILSDFVLPRREESAPEYVARAQEIGSAIAGAWVALCTSIVRRTVFRAKGYIVAGKAFTTPFLAMQRSVEQLNLAFGETLLSIEKKTVSLQYFYDVSGSNIVKDVGVSVSVELTQVKVEKRTTSKLVVVGEKLGSLAEALDGILALAALREALKKEKRDNIVTVADSLRLAKSVIALSGGFVTSMRSVTEKMSRKDIAKLAGRFAAVANAIDMLASSGDALHNIQTGDRDAAAGNLMEVAGGGMVLVGLLLASNPAGWIIAGTVLGLGGALVAASNDDTPFDKLFNHSPFGDSPLTDALEAEDPAWTLTTSTYAEWDRRTTQGVETFIDAAQQLQFAFSVKGASPLGAHPASATAFDIEVKELRQESTIHVQYTVIYRGSAPFEGETKEVSGYLWILGLSKKPFLADYADTPDATKTNFKMTDVVTVKDGVVHVELHPLTDVKTKSGSPMEVGTVRLKVRLDVHGDAYEAAGGSSPKTARNMGDQASLIVPTTAAGKRWVKLIPILNGRKETEAATSFSLKDLSS